MGLRFARALQQRVEVSHAAGLKVLDWTLEVYVRIDSAPSSGQNFTLVCNGGEYAGGASTYELEYINVGGTYYLSAGLWNNASAACVYVQVAQTLTPGRWYAVAATFTGAGTKVVNLYVAERASPDTFTGATTYTQIATDNANAGTFITTGTEKLRFGCGVDSAGAVEDFANATIAQVAVYSSVLSKATLDSRLGTRLTGTESTLIALHRFDEGTGSTSYDRALAVGRNGTLHNRPEWADAPLDLYYPTGNTTDRGFLGTFNAIRGRRATVTASSEAAAYPATDLRSPISGRPTRTANVTGAKTWVFDLGSPFCIAALSVGRHNLTSAATVVLAGHTADSWGAPAVTEAVTFHPSRLVHLTAREHGYRYWRLSVTDAANGDGYISLGAVGLWVGLALQEPAEMTDTATIVDASGAVDVREADSVVRTVTPSVDVAFGLRAISRGVGLELRRHLEAAGTGAPVLAVLDPRRGLYSRTTYGYVSALPQEQMHDIAWTRVDVASVGVVADRA